MMVGLMTETPIENEPRHVGTPSLWQENHGNWLLGGVALILLVGASILWYRQNRFVPAPFPESRMIENSTGTPSPEPADGQPSVVIMVTGAVSDFGKMMVAIYDSEQNFNQPEIAILQQQLDIVDGQASWKVAVSRMPEKLAIAAYHDTNGDQILNRNSFGIPSERYGFSRNARGLTGPPGFQQAVIDRPEAGTQIEVFVR
jgi:uncharacterized protein (DUF2141 family)